MTKKKLKLAKGLSLPIDAVTQALAFMGRRGSGKTYGAGRMAEQMLDAGAQLVVLDPVGVHWGLRLAKDGEKKGFDIPVLGGPRADIPLEPEAGALIADFVVEQRASLVLDVSFMRKGQMRQFMTDFAEQLVHQKKRNRSAMHVLVEEAQLFIPQKAYKGQERMLGAMEDLVKLGRNWGVGVTMITQRPQAVNKDALNQAEALFVFQTSGPHERKAIEGWIVEKGLEKEEFKDDIPRLQTGDCYVYSPAWLRILERVHIYEKKTFDASATPEFGADSEALQELAPVDLESLQAAMAETIERQKESDPKHLQKRIRELEKDLKRVRAEQPEPEVQIEREEIPVLSDEMREDARELAKGLRQGFEELPCQIEEAVTPLVAAIDRFEELVERAADVGGRIVGAIEEYSGNGRARARGTRKARSRTRTSAVEAPTARPSPRPLRPSSDPDPEFEPAAPDQKILDAIAWLEGVGVTPADKVAVAAIAGYRPTSGHFQNVLGRLRSAGMIDYPKPGLVVLTRAGGAYATEPDVPGTVAELHAFVNQTLSGPETKILAPLLEVWPDAISKEELAEQSGYSPTSGHFQNVMGRLRTLGLIDYPEPGCVIAQDILFPEALLS